MENINQTRFEEIKKLLTKQISNTIPDADQPIYAMCDASYFGIGATTLQSPIGTKKKESHFSKSSPIYTS